MSSRIEPWAPIDWHKVQVKGYSQLILVLRQMEDRIIALEHSQAAPDRCPACGLDLLPDGACPNDLPAGVLT
jgi:hypothetical protein